MRLLPRVLLGTAAVALALALVPAAAGADSGGDDQPLLRSGLVGSTPVASGGVVLSGVTPGGVPWVVGSGRVRVDRDGSLGPGRPGPGRPDTALQRHQPGSD